MKKYFCYLVGVFVFLYFCSTALAQNPEPKPMTSSGTLALLGTLNGAGPFALSGPSGNGANDPKIIEGFGLRYYFADKWAIRALASFGSKSVNDTTSSTLWGLGAAVEYHLHEVYSTDIYVSGGLGYKSVSTKNLTLGTVLVFNPAEGKGAPLSGIEGGEAGDWHVNAFGITVAAGFDWYPWNGIAIGAEYSLGFVTSSVTQTINGTETDIHNIFPAQSSFGISGGTNVHLVVVF